MGAAAQHAVTELGSGRSTVVLGHGLGGDQTQWGPVAAVLSREARVITFDNAASGRCAPEVFSPDRHASVQGFADDLAAVCADLGVRGATFVGHSMAGMAGALASIDDPGLFSRLVTIGASARYADDPATGYVGGFSTEAIDEMLATVRADFDRWSEGFAPLVMGDDARPELSEEFARSLRRYSPDVAWTVFTAAFRSDFRAEMNQVPVPTLLLQSTADPAVPLEAAQWLADAVPGARLQVLGVRGHFPHVVAPAEVVRALTRFGVGA
jgi:sigma-B regulation protein RsbQ